MWNLITGLILTIFGSYTVYQHFTGGAFMPPFKLMLSFVFIGFGVHNLYKYLKNR